MPLSCSTNEAREVINVKKNEHSSVSGRKEKLEDPEDGSGVEANVLSSWTEACIDTGWAEVFQRDEKHACVYKTTPGKLRILVL